MKSGSSLAFLEPTRVNKITDPKLKITKAEAEAEEEETEADEAEEEEEEEEEDNAYFCT